jgi:hypothetical protein
MIYRFSRSCGVGGDLDVRRGEFFAEQALRPAHQRQSHTDTLPRSGGVAVAARVFPVLFIVNLAPAMLARRHSRRSPQKIKC